MPHPRKWLSNAGVKIERGFNKNILCAAALVCGEARRPVGRHTQLSAAIKTKTGWNRLTLMPAAVRV